MGNQKKTEKKNAQEVSATQQMVVSPLSSASIFSPSYVPQELLAINQAQVSVYLSAKKDNDLTQVAEIYDATVKETPMSPSEQCRKPWDSRVCVKVPLELNFAINNNNHPRTRKGYHVKFKDINDSIGRDDYVTTWMSLLGEEREEMLMLYERFSQYNLTLSVKGRTASIKIPGIADARPPLQHGDTILLRPHRALNFGRGTELYYGTTGGFVKPFLELCEIQSDVIATMRGNWKADTVTFTWLDPKKYPSSTMPPITNYEHTARFIPSPTNYERCLTALKWFTRLNPNVAKELVFPTKAPKLPEYKEPLMDPRIAPLNEKQTLFVNMVLARTTHPSLTSVRPPMILTGPAGTGKTRTLLVAILKTLQMSTEENQKRILVCTPSHNAADVVTRRLGKHLSRQELFRLYDKDRPVQMVPTEMLAFARQGRSGDFELPPVDELLKFQVIVCTCSDAHLLYLCGITNASLRARRQNLVQWIKQSVKESHLTMTGDFLGANETHFTHLFIDEAAQATEPETLIPFSVVVDDHDDALKAEIALVGDPRQLSPTINSPWAAEGLQRSLMERLLRLPVEVLGGGRDHLLGPPTKDNWTNLDELIEYSFERTDDHENLSVFLTLSYRGHPSFLLMPSKLFYFGKLQSAVPHQQADKKWISALRELEAASTPANPGGKKSASCPIHFRGVVGKDVSTAVYSFWGSNSWTNLEEATEVLMIVQKLVSSGVSTMEIGIMAAFRAQVVLIRRQLRENELGNVNVGMVEDFQAVEKEIIILSLTRSNEEFCEFDVRRRAGLFNQPKRTNVALTRSEHMLVVVGNPDTMAKDPIWSEWLSFCSRNGFWYGSQGEGSSLETNGRT